MGVSVSFSAQTPQLFLLREPRLAQQMLGHSLARLRRRAWLARITRVSLRAISMVCSKQSARATLMPTFIVIDPPVAKSEPRLMVVGIVIIIMIMIVTTMETIIDPVRFLIEK